VALAFLAAGAAVGTTDLGYLYRLTGARGVTVTGGTTNEASYLVRLGTDGLFDASVLRGAGASNATQVVYDNPAYSNVAAALDYLLYLAPSATLSGGGTYDIGRTVTNAAFTFTVNKTVTSRLLSAPSLATADLGAGGSGSYTYTNALLSAAKTFTLTVDDGTTNAAATTSFAFRHRFYAGFVTNETVRKIVFTGSTEVGKQIMAGCAAQIKRVTLELGGKSANIVFNDADVEKAAATAPYAVFENAGQDCCARSRILVQRDVYD
jgi:hypothetical protein